MCPYLLLEHIIKHLGMKQSLATTMHVRPLNAAEETNEATEDQSLLDMMFASQFAAFVFDIEAAATAVIVAGVFRR